MNATMLISGLSYSQLSFYHRIGRSTMSTVIPDTLQAIISNLKPYIEFPREKAKWKSIAAEFEQLWNFPYCLGAIDGKHVLIEAPSESGSLYYNYKGTFSVILMAMTDANYRFLFVDIGCNGRVGDAGLYEQCKLKSFMENNNDLPKFQNLPNSDIVGHHVILGDSAFPLQTYLMKPYPERNIKRTERIFNYR